MLNLKLLSIYTEIVTNIASLFYATIKVSYSVFSS